MYRQFSSPIDLRKRSSPVVIIYGEDRNKDFTKILWELIPAYDVQLANPKSINELCEVAYDSALVFVMVDDADDETLRVAEALSNIKGVVADVVAITREPDIRRRLHILSARFDAIYNLDIVGSNEFSQIFHHKLKKGIMRLNSRLQEDEYNTFLGFLSVSADAFIVFDPQKRIFYVSEHYLRLYPRSRHVFERGVPVQRVFEAIADEMGVRQHDPRYQSALDFWVSLKGQFEFRLDNGLHLRLTAVDLPGGQGTIVSTTNITTYKNQEFALAKQQKELERALEAEQEASALQKQFISMVSHEFRTPLAIVDGNAQIIQRLGKCMSDEEMTSRLTTIRSAVSRTVSMMEAVLSSNMLKTGKLDLNCETFDVAVLISELCDEQSNLARGHRIIKNIRMTPTLGYFDKKFLTIILTNLLSNAVKFTDPDRGEIEVSAQTFPNTLIVQIKDNGLGIPADDLNRVFEKFYRASNSSGIPGSGVGLPLVRDLVHMHHGEISVESAEGVGTVFTLRFPQDYTLEAQGSKI